MGSFIEKIDGDWTLQTLNANNVVTIDSSTISLLGNVYTPSQISAVGNIITSQYFIGNFAGNITGNLHVPGANTEVLFNNNGNAGASSGLTFDFATNALVSGGVVSAIGNIIAGNVYTIGNVTGNYILGNGAFLTGLADVYSNANVANYLPIYTGNLVSLQGPVTTTANITAGNILTGGLISATGDVTSAANVTGGNLFTSGAISATGNLDSGNVRTTGDASATGNVYGNNLIGTNLVKGTTLSATGNVIANNISFSSTLTGSVVSTSGNITGSNINGIRVSAVANVTGGNLVTAGTLSATGGANIGNDTFIDGNLTVTGNAVLYGNILGDRIINGNTSVEIQTPSGNANVSVGGVSNVAVFTTTGLSVTGNTLTNGNVSASGNITGNYFIGNGSQLTGVIASAVNANSLTGNQLANNVIFSNLTTLGTLVSATVSGNVTGGNINTAGQISAAGNITGGNLSVTFVAGTLTTASQPNITSVGTLTSLSVSGNIQTAGQLSATGNVSGNYFIGNGSQLTGVVASAVNANALTGSQLANNVIYSNLSTLGNNVTVGNLNALGQLSAVGNVIGNYILGNISQATGYNSNTIYNGTSNISILTPNGNVTVSVNSTGNVAVFAADGLNISGNLSVTGNIIGNTFVGNGAGLTSIMADRGNDPNNWNTLTQMGVYTVNRSDWSGTVGTPLDSMIYVGLLEVKNSTNTSLEQSFYPGAVVTGNVKTQWNRVYWGGSWSAWYYVVNDDQVLVGGDF